jgi:hypothetical protein
VIALFISTTRIRLIKIHTLLEKLAIGLLLLGLFFILTTFIADLTQQSDWQRVFGLNLHRVLELLDLREENTLATWFSSMVFLATGGAFLLLGWGTSPEFAISRLTRLIFQLAAIGAVLLSADEVASVHETAGKWFQRFVSSLWQNAPQDEKGFFWVVLFAPFLLAGLLAAAYVLRQLIRRMPTDQDWQRYAANMALLVALLCLPGVFVFELSEWYLQNSVNQSSSILTCWEEAFELIGMYSLFLCAMFIARRYQL